MKNFLKGYPLPISGLILGLLSLGNLVNDYGTFYKNILIIISLIFIIFLIMKILIYPKTTINNLQNPIIASSFPTFSMAMMILATYIIKISTNFAYIIWVIGLCLHVILIFWFTNKFVLKFNINSVFPSWFIVYVGIVTASVTAPIFKIIIIGKFAFWFGLVSYIILLPIVLYRILKVKNMPEISLPTLIILSAPASLLLAGYMKSFEVKNIIIVWFLIIFSVLMYFISIILLFNLLKLKFYPSYSSFTFPLVISALSIKLTNGFFINKGQPIILLNYLMKFEEIIAIIAVIYVLFRYVIFLSSKYNNALSR